MKKLIVFLTLSLVLVMGLRAQGNASRYTYGELEKQGKLELTKIYIEQVNKMIMLMPFLPFNQKGDAVSLANMGIPNTKDNNDAIKLLDASTAGHTERLQMSLENIIPYADKEDIINAILFMQGIIDRIEAGL